MSSTATPEEAKQFARSNEVVRSSNYAGKHFVTTNAGYTIYQTINNLSAGTRYNIETAVNIPDTTDAFKFKLQVRWIDATNKTISTKTIKIYTGHTTSAPGGWDTITTNLAT